MNIPPGCVPIDPASEEDTTTAVRDLYTGLAKARGPETVESAREAAIALISAAGMDSESLDHFDQEITESVQTLLMMAFMREPRLLYYVNYTNYNIL